MAVVTECHSCWGVGAPCHKHDDGSFGLEGVTYTRGVRPVAVHAWSGNSEDVW